MFNAYADHLKRWDVILVAAEANAGEPGFEDLRFQLDAAFGAARGALAQQALLRSQLQQATRDLDDFMANGKEAYSRLRRVVKGRYGLRSEKLAEFGLQPLRPAQRAIKEKPPESGQTPTQAATPATESSI